MQYGEPLPDIWHQQNYHLEQHIQEDAKKAMKIMHSMNLIHGDIKP